MKLDTLHAHLPWSRLNEFIDLFNELSLHAEIGLTGSDEEIARVTKAYHAFYKKVPTEGDDYTIDHTASVYLMDADGKLQSIIDYHEDPKTSLAKLERLVDKT